MAMMQRCYFVLVCAVLLPWFRGVPMAAGTALNLEGLTAADKLHDGTTDAMITAWGVLVGVEGGDDVTLNIAAAVATFDTPDVGEDKLVTVTGLALDGVDAWNYTIGDQTTTATIVLGVTALGTPIAWYHQHGIGPYPGDTWDDVDLYDSDGDGMLNWQEYLAGTDPWDADSFLRVLRFTVQHGQLPHIEWRGGASGPVRPYVIQWTDSLVSPDWQDVPGSETDRSDDAPLYEWTGDDPVAGCRFYRIIVPPNGGAGGEVLSRNVVGYATITLDSGLNLVAFPFQKIPAARGVVSANTGTTITDAGASWTAFNAGVIGAEPTGASTFYIEITSGAFEGRHMYIASNTDDTLTITGGLPADIAANELAGAGYKIVAANRIRDLFGEPGEPLLSGGYGAGDGDNIITWDWNRWDAAIHYKLEDEWDPNPALDNQWVQAHNVVNDMVIDRDQAMFVRSRDAAEKAITMVGEVSANAQSVVLNSGLNLIGGLSVVEEAIGSSLLGNALTGGYGAGDADNVLGWLGGAWEWEVPVYFQMEDEWDPRPGLDNSWVQSGVNVNDTFRFVPTKGYFFRVRTVQPKGAWIRESPLAAE